MTDRPGPWRGPGTATTDTHEWRTLPLIRGKASSAIRTSDALDATIGSFLPGHVEAGMRGTVVVRADARTMAP